jgi:hypothetical protein
VAQTDPVQKYFDSLLASYDILVDAVEKAGERGLKVSRQLTTDVIKGQREAIELGRKLASEPTDAGSFYTALLESATDAQNRALTFAQDAYQEALSAGADARETIEKLVAANQETTLAAVEAARSFAAANPWADALRRGFETLAQPQSTTKPKKEKAAATA